MESSQGHGRAFFKFLSPSKRIINNSKQSILQIHVLCKYLKVQVMNSQLAHTQTLRPISSSDQKNIPSSSDFPKFKTSIRLFLVSTMRILVIRGRNHFSKMSTLVSTWDRGYQSSGQMVLASLHSSSCLLGRSNRLTVSIYFRPNFVKLSIIPNLKIDRFPCYLRAPQI